MSLALENTSAPPAWAVRSRAMRNIAFAALKWTAIAVWFDITGRLISSPLDRLFAAYPALTWLDGLTNVVCK